MVVGEHGPDLHDQLQFGSLVRDETASAAKIRALEFEPDSLKYEPEVKTTDAETGAGTVVTPADYAAAVQKILDAWDDMIGRTITDKKAELWERCYMVLQRPTSESVTNFALNSGTWWPR